MRTFVGGWSKLARSRQQQSSRAVCTTQLDAGRVHRHAAAMASSSGERRTNMAVSCS